MHRSQFGNSVPIDSNEKVKRTTSLFSIRNSTSSNQPSDQYTTNAILSPSPMFQYLPQRRATGIHRFQLNNKSPNRIETDPNNNASPPIITVPHLMEFSRRVSRSSSANDHVMATIDTNIDSKQPNTLAKHDTPNLNTKPTSVNSDANEKRIFSQKSNTFVVKQPLNSIDYIMKDKLTSSEHERNNNINYQSNTADRIKQILKKQFFFPLEKTKKL